MKTLGIIDKFRSRKAEAKESAEVVYRRNLLAEAIGQKHDPVALMDAAEALHYQAGDIDEDRQAIQRINEMERGLRSYKSSAEYEQEIVGVTKELERLEHRKLELIGQRATAEALHESAVHTRLDIERSKRATPRIWPSRIVTPVVKSAPKPTVWDGTGKPIRN